MDDDEPEPANASSDRRARQPAPIVIYCESEDKSATTKVAMMMAGLVSVVGTYLACVCV